MQEPKADDPRIAVVGLGYVGLPLAVALARSFPTVGYDIDRERIAELRRGHDRTHEVGASALAGGVEVSDDAAILDGRDVYIVTVPTPVDDENRPDLSAVEDAAEAVGRRMARGAVVVFESTVYPGVTEDVAGPILESSSGLGAGRDFFLGYSPERINVGDPEHGLAGIPKVVAGQTPEVARLLARIYGTVAASIFVAKDIRTAEAAKVIENAQRDINIAFINEVSMIFERLGLSVHDVLEAAGTKWNFHRYQPGLVGGHCIGVDPYYLAHAATAAGLDPHVILAGRRINDGMGAFFAERVWHALGQPRNARILVLGLTFKENVPDLRNSKVADLIRRLESLGADVAVHDPLGDPVEARDYYGFTLARDLGAFSGLDAIVGAVAHDDYRRFVDADFVRLLRPGGLVADIKGIWRDRAFPAGLRRWAL
ncbi:MAG: nucleotide sugar dehydrogenase [Alphaproteobacteria bacterium]|nr:nucleotide sugar dehydrogenase [Alphaproteobacteria bacterium]